MLCTSHIMQCVNKVDQNEKGTQLCWPTLTRSVDDIVVSSSGRRTSGNTCMACMSREEIVNWLGQMGASGNLFLQTGRIMTDEDYRILKQRVLGYEYHDNPR